MAQFFISAAQLAQFQKTLEQIETTTAATFQWLKSNLGAYMASANALDAQITALTQSVANETTVTNSAVTLLNGIPALIANAVAQAQAAGATAAELAALTDLQKSISTNATTLAAAVSANTPAAPPVQ